MRFRNGLVTAVGNLQRKQRKQRPRWKVPARCARGPHREQADLPVQGKDMQVTEDMEDMVVEVELAVVGQWGKNWGRRLPGGTSSTVQVIRVEL